MREHYQAPWVLVESGTTGPDFYIPGVEAGFTAVGVAGPEGVKLVKVFHSKKGESRVDNMKAFAEFAFGVLMEGLEEYERRKGVGSKL